MNSWLIKVHENQVMKYESNIRSAIIKVHENPWIQEFMTYRGTWKSGDVFMNSWLLRELVQFCQKLLSLNRTGNDMIFQNWKFALLKWSTLLYYYDLYNKWREMTKLTKWKIFWENWEKGSVEFFLGKLKKWSVQQIVRCDKIDSMEKFFWENWEKRSADVEFFWGKTVKNDLYNKIERYDKID